MKSSRIRKWFGVVLASGVAVGSMAVASPVSAASDTVVLGFSLEPLSLDISGTAGQAIPQVLL
ncbi:MAG: hypothetical protein ACKOBR_05995, partial [Actinomycetota bacterium]